MIQPRPARLLPLLAAVLLLAVAGTALRAQTVGGSVGLAVPVGPLAEEHDVGFRLQGSVYSPRGRARLDVAGVSFPASRGADSLALGGEYQSVSVGANLLPVLYGSETLRVRGVVGLSGHRVRVPRTNNPYGTVPGLQVGGLVERSWNGHVLTAEAGLHVIASDHGLGELEGAFFIPVGIGVRW